MGTKQVQMKFQVAANDGELVQVTITAGGTQVFSGSLAQTPHPVPGKVANDATPFSLIEFELDVDNMPVPPGTVRNANGVLDIMAASDGYGAWTTPTDITIAVSGGNVCLQSTLANYSARMVLVPPNTFPKFSMVPGDAATFTELRYATQPVWTPAAVDRLNLAENVDTGPGSLLLLDNESVSYQVSMSLYSA